MSSSGREFVRYSLKSKALELIPEGRELKSKRISYHFFNAGKFYEGLAIKALGEAYADAIVASKLQFDAAFGKSYKGSAIVVATVMALARNGFNKGWAYDRKEVKDHGEGGLIVGAPLKDREVLLVDDVITTGESLIEADSIVKAQGGTPVGCLIAFDRQEYGVNAQRTAAEELEHLLGIPVYAASTLKDLIDELSDGIIPGSYPLLEKILEYKKQYCVPD